MARQKQRENYGNGSITKKLDKDGNQIVDRQGRKVLVVCLSFGYDTFTDKDGKSHRRQNKVQRVVHGSIADARRVHKELIDQYEHIDVSASKEKTFATVCDDWETSMRNSGRASVNALNGYLINLGHMRAMIGDKPLVSITKQDVEDALGQIRVERKLSGTTMNKIFSVTKRVFTYAVNSVWLVRNPCAAIDAPRINKDIKRRALSDEECVFFAQRLDRAEA